jgi:hypothetical protein
MEQTSEALPSKVGAFRLEYRRNEISRRYSGPLHFAFMLASGTVGMGVALSAVEAPTVPELAMLPAAFLFANLVEYGMHRWPMHHRFGPLGLLFERHTLQHHRFFTRQAMSYDTTRDWKMVLFPPVIIVALASVAAPTWLLLRTLWSANAAWLFVAVALGYYVLYEILHTTYHSRDGSWVARLPLLSRLRRHHTVHHDPRLMTRHNFNITFPICDVLFRTTRETQQ